MGTFYKDGQIGSVAVLAQSYAVLVRKSNSPGLEVVTNITHKNDEQLICITTEKNAKMVKYCLECLE